MKIKHPYPNSSSSEPIRGKKKYGYLIQTNNMALKFLRNGEGTVIPSNLPDFLTTLMPIHRPLQLIKQPQSLRVQKGQDLRNKQPQLPLLGIHPKIQVSESTPEPAAGPAALGRALFWIQHQPARPALREAREQFAVERDLRDAGYDFADCVRRADFVDVVREEILLYGDVLQNPRAGLRMLAAVEEREEECGLVV